MELAGFVFAFTFKPECVHLKLKSKISKNKESKLPENIQVLDIYFEILRAINPFTGM